MHINIFNHGANRDGGAEVYTKELALGLAARGHDVTVICCVADDEVEHACRVIRLADPKNLELPWVWRFSLFLEWFQWRKRLRQAELPTCDICIVSPVLWFSGICSRVPDVPVVYLPHSRIAPHEVTDMLKDSHSRLMRRLIHQLYWRLEKKALCLATSTVRFFQQNEILLRREYGLLPQTRIDIIQQGVYLKTVESPPRHSDKIRLLTVGRLVESKNLAFLLQTLTKLKSSAWKLDIVGEGPQREPLQNIVNEAGLAANVSFHGQQTDVGSFYRNADLFVFPSRLESGSLVMLEAMSHELPVIAIASDGCSYFNSNREILTPGLDGLLAANEREFQTLLKNAIDSPDILPALGKRARQTVMDKYRWEAVLDRWEELLRELTANSPSTQAELTVGKP